MKNLLLSLLLPSDLKYLEPHLKPARFRPEKWLKLRWSGSMAWWARPRRSTARWR